LDYPKTTEIDDLDVLNDMKRCREIITEGLAMRMNKTETEEQIKVRQPLSEMTYAGEKLPEFYEGIIADEVNVKKVTQGDKNYLNKTLTPELEAEGFVRELIRSVQAARKKAGLTVNDHILLSVSCDVPEGFNDLFMAEVLADSVVTEGNYAYDEIVKVNGENVTISLQKA
jgi:isoleucyl-tRNA synthetase